MKKFKVLYFLFTIILLINFTIKITAYYNLNQYSNSRNFNPPSKYSIGLRYNRYGRAEYDFSEQDAIKNCGKRKRTVEMNRKCFRQCQTDTDCRGSKRKCLCDGECGLSCVRITTACSKVGEFKNGYVNYYPDNFFGAQLVYECQPGYSLIGDKVRICEGDGWWSGSSPVCTKETYCDPPAQIQNAIPNIQISNQSKYKTGTEVEYQCDIGYTRNSNDDSSKIVCLDSGKWSEMKFKCSRINCGRPDEIDNGIIKGTDYYYSSVIEYKCMPGYRIRNGDYLRECDLDSKWSGRKPSCEPVDCGEPPFVKNAIVNYNSTRFGNKATYECISYKYYIESINEINCLPNGRWTEPLPKCIEKTCALDSSEYSKKIYNLFSSSPSSPSNQFVNENYTYSINTIIRFICQPGYVLKGESQQLTCLLENNDKDEKVAKWNFIPPKCKPELFCPFINPPENGLLSSNRQPTSSGYYINTTLEFTCMNGYKLKGSKNFICIEKAASNQEEEIDKAEWQGGDITCDLDVEAQVLKPNNILTTISMLPSASISESCKIDFSSMLISYSNLNEIQSQAFNDDFVFLNASIGDFIRHSQIVLYYCKTNNLIHYSAKCINGTLLMQQNSSKSPCTSPPKIANGYNKYSSSLHGSKVLYQCFNGYELSKGSSELKCFDGEWVGSVPVCTKINCGYPGILENGRILYIGTLSEYTYQPYMNTVGQNKQIRYECDKDYKLVGPNGSTCINGNWKPSMKLVRCIKDQRVTDKMDEKNPNDEQEIYFPNPTTTTTSTSPTKNDMVLLRQESSQLYSGENDYTNRNFIAKRKMKKNLKLKRLKKEQAIKSNNNTNNKEVGLKRKRVQNRAKKLNHFHEKKQDLNNLNN